jgi:hypothetical protein
MNAEEEVGKSACVRPPVRMCVRCQRITEVPVLVREVHAGSGPGFNVYACPDCAPHITPGPDALEVIELARQHRSKGAGR